jgi:hypothetical protein
MDRNIIYSIMKDIRHAANINEIEKNRIPKEHTAKLKILQARFV